MKAEPLHLNWVLRAIWSLLQHMALGLSNRRVWMGQRLSIEKDVERNEAFEKATSCRLVQLVVLSSKLPSP